MRPLVLPIMLVAMLFGCNGNGSSGSSGRPVPVVKTPTPTTIYFDIAIFGSSTLTGPVGQFTGPLAVLVTDPATGKPVDGVNVAFRATGSPASWGPWGLGDTLSGDGMWGVSMPGTGVAAVGCTPAVVGSVMVTATVVPVVASVPTPPRGLEHGDLHGDG